eukprot:COSAG01_NODE_2572_length_7436_cov_3.363500_4_plen_79_part_00
MEPEPEAEEPLPQHVEIRDVLVHASTPLGALPLCGRHRVRNREVREQYLEYSSHGYFVPLVKLVIYSIAAIYYTHLSI